MRHKLLGFCLINFLKCQWMWEHVVIEFLPTSHQCAKYKGECGLFCWARRMGTMFCTQPLNYYFNFTYVWFTSTAISECWCSDALFRGEKWRSHMAILTELWFRVWLAWFEKPCDLHDVMWLRGEGEHVCVAVQIDACSTVCTLMHAHTYTRREMKHKMHQMGWYCYLSWLSATWWRGINIETNLPK